MSTDLTFTLYDMVKESNWIEPFIFKACIIMLLICGVIIFCLWVQFIISKMLYLPIKKTDNSVKQLKYAIKIVNGMLSMWSYTELDILLGNLKQALVYGKELDNTSIYILNTALSKFIKTEKSFEIILEKATYICNSNSTNTNR